MRNAIVFSRRIRIKNTFTTLAHSPYSEILHLLLCPEEGEPHPRVPIVTPCKGVWTYTDKQIHEELEQEGRKEMILAHFPVLSLYVCSSVQKEANHIHASSF